MKKHLFILNLFLLSCGVRDVTPQDNRASQIQGTWISQTAKDQCHERLVINSDNSFAWDQPSLSDKGSYKLIGNKIEFMYTKQNSNTFQYSVDDYNLTLKKLNCDTKYIKIPKDSTKYIDSMKFVDGKECWFLVADPQQQQQQQQQKPKKPKKPGEPTPDPTPTPTPTDDPPSPTPTPTPTNPPSDCKCCCCCCCEPTPSPCPTPTPTPTPTTPTPTPPYEHKKCGWWTP